MNDAGKFLKWASSVRNTREGSVRQRRWNAAAGVSALAPWCSTFIAYGLKLVGITPPADPAYSGSWLSWEGGEQVDGGYKDAKPGDLLIFDWGDGGRTDHVAAYLGGGRMIAGNNSNNTVGISSVPEGNIVGVVRPKKFGDVNKGFLDTLITGDPLTLIGTSGDAVKDTIKGALGDAADAAIPSAADVGEWLIDQLGINASAIVLNVGLVGGGAFLMYYGLSKAAGVSAPAGRVLGAIAGGPAGAAKAVAG